MDSAKLRELLVLRDKIIGDGEDYKRSEAADYEEDCAEFITEHGKALLDELDALRALRDRVEAAPIGTAWLDAHPWPTIDDIDVEKGRRFRLLAVDAGEVGNG